MDQKQKIFNLIAKTAKTQLSATRKVKFALTDDLLELSKEASDLNRDAFAKYQEYEELQNQYSEDLRAMQMLLDQSKEEAEVLLDEIQSKYRQVESASSDIGIEIPDRVQIAYDDAVEYLQWVINPKGF